jgi:hypothetical protein
MNKSITLLLGFLVLLPVSVLASEVQESKDYYKISSVAVQEVVPTAEEIASGYLAPTQSPRAFLEGAESLDWNAMVLIGEKIIQIIKAGKAVVNIKRDAVAALPVGVNNWQELAGWQAPVTKVYTVKVTNYLGMDVVDLRLKVSAMWGGNLAGKGQYLSNVLIVPSAMKVLWGWNLDLWSENRDPVNSGSLEAPKAGLGFDIRYRVTTMLNELNGTQDYFITGDGNILVL